MGEREPQALAEAEEQPEGVGGPDGERDRLPDVEVVGEEEAEGEAEREKEGLPEAVGEAPRMEGEAPPLAEGGARVAEARALSEPQGLTDTLPVALMDLLLVTVVHGEAEAERECEGEGEAEGEGVALAPEARGEPEEEVEGVEDPLSEGEWLLLCEAHALVPVAFGDRDAVGEVEGGPR